MLANVTSKRFAWIGAGLLLAALGPGCYDAPTSTSPVVFEMASAARRLAAWGPAVSIDPDGLNGVNTPAMEGCPIESPNGRQLFFASDRAGESGIDIWVAHRDGRDEPWGDPEILPAPVNSAQDDFCPTPLPGGKLLFVSRRPGGCGTNDSDIYETRLHPRRGWREPTHLGCEINSGADEFSPSYVPAGGGLLFFSSNRSGVHKIYVSRQKRRGGWRSPEEVTELNVEEANTLRPNVSHDGREIVFDSDRSGTLGSFDVWAATRRSAFATWSEPFHLGENINTASAETRASLSRDGKRLYFGSPRTGGEGSTDIYVARRRH